MAAPSIAPTRAPALYVSGRLADAAENDPPFSFRLPCPPAWDDRAPGAWAAERRARRAYFAAMDALRTGTVDAAEEAKVHRLIGDLKSPSARAGVTHFLRIFDFVRRKRAPIVPTPPGPLAEVVITAPAVRVADPDALATRYRWAMEWLDARRYVVGKGLRLKWQVRRVTLGGIVVEPAVPGHDARRAGSAV